MQTPQHRGDTKGRKMATANNKLTAQERMTITQGVELAIASNERMNAKEKDPRIKQIRSESIEAQRALLNRLNSQELEL